MSRSTRTRVAALATIALLGGIVAVTAGPAGAQDGVGVYFVNLKARNAVNFEGAETINVDVCVDDGADPLWANVGLAATAGLATTDLTVGDHDIAVFPAVVDATCAEHVAAASADPATAPLVAGTLPIGEAGSTGPVVLLLVPDAATAGQNNLISSPTLACPGTFMIGNATDTTSNVALSNGEIANTDGSVTTLEGADLAPLVPPTPIFGTYDPPGTGTISITATLTAGAVDIPVTDHAYDPSSQVSFLFAYGGTSSLADDPDPEAPAYASAWLDVALDCPVTPTTTTTTTSTPGNTAPTATPVRADPRVTG